MAKTVYVCENCGVKQAKWMGKCPNCGTWSSLVEEVETKLPKNLLKKSFEKYPLDKVLIEGNMRFESSLKEFDRVLGGGLVKGEVILLTGNPGIGKSTSKIGS